MNELIPSMEAASYHASAGISKHGLDLIRHAPAKYWHQHCNPQEEQTPAMRFGTLAHLAILEPEKFSDETFVMPSCDRRTKEGKEVYAEAMRQAAGRMVITPDEQDQLAAMRESLMADKACKTALGHQEYVEASLYWIDPAEDVQCRCRPDLIRKDGIIVDYKTTDNATPGAFLRTILNFRYHVQAAFYADGYQQVTGQECPTFLFVAQEKKPPYLSAVYMVDEAMIQAGRRAYQEDLATYKNCRETGNWFGISSKPITLTLPSWAKTDQTWE